MERLEKLERKVKDWLARRVGATRRPEIDERIRCPEPSCSRVMLYRDIFEHFFAAHIFPEYPYQVDGKEEETTGNNTHGTDFSVSDYVDDYDLDRPEEEDQGIELQEATGGQGGRAQKLRVYHGVITDRIEEEGELVIKSTTHIGSTRGFDIIRKFKQAVRRIPNDSLDNYEIEGDENYGSYPVKVRRP